MYFPRKNTNKFYTLFININKSWTKVNFPKNCAFEKNPAESIHRNRLSKPLDRRKFCINRMDPLIWNSPEWMRTCPSICVENDPSETDKREFRTLYSKYLRTRKGPRNCFSLLIRCSGVEHLVTLSISRESITRFWMAHVPLEVIF